MPPANTQKNQNEIFPEMKKVVCSDLKIGSGNIRIGQGGNGGYRQDKQQENDKKVSVISCTTGDKICFDG